MTSKLTKSYNSALPMQIMGVLDRVERGELFDVGASWFPNGKGFCINDKKKFAKIALPNYFNNIRFSSFTRQMRRWGFKAVQGFQRNSASYSHHLFTRGGIQSCKRMRPLGQVRPSQKDGVGSNNKTMTGLSYLDKKRSTRTSAAFDLLALSKSAETSGTPTTPAATAGEQALVLRGHVDADALLVPPPVPQNSKIMMPPLVVLNRQHPMIEYHQEQENRMPPLTQKIHVQERGATTSNSPPVLLEDATTSMSRRRSKSLYALMLQEEQNRDLVMRGASYLHHSSAALHRHHHKPAAPISTLAAEPFLFSFSRNAHLRADSLLMKELLFSEQEQEIASSSRGCPAPRTSPLPYSSFLGRQTFNPVRPFGMLTYNGAGVCENPFW